MATIVTQFDIDGLVISTKRGAVTVTPTEAEILRELKFGGRVCIVRLIGGYADMTAHERIDARYRLNTHVGNMRPKIRPIGLDVVTIRGWGYRMGEMAAANTRNLKDAPTATERLMLEEIEAGKRPVAVPAGLSDFDRERIHRLSERGLSLTGIAAQLRKPYAAVAAEMGMR